MKKWRSVGMLFAALMVIVGMLTGAASAYDITGTVTYSGGTASRVYIAGDSLNGPNGRVGTSIDSIGTGGSASFTIRGVPPGEYKLRAFIDRTGYGSRHASDPSGYSSPINVNDSNVTGVAISLADPAPVAPQAPFEVIVFPGSGAAVVSWEGPKSAEGHEIADSYNIYWSKDPAVSPTNTTGGGSFKGYPANDESHYALTGLNNGDQFYFVVTAQLGNQESAPSPVFGPVTIGPLSGGATVSGTVSLSGTYSAGKLYVAVADENDNIYITCAQSPSFPQAYSVTGVPDGNYRIFAILDVNGDGVIGIGDISPVDEQAPQISVSGGTVNGSADAILVQQDARARMTTGHWKNSTYEGYTLDFDIRGSMKQPVRATLNGGPGLSGPIDMSLSEWDSGGFHTWRGVPSRPAVDDSYTIDVVYSDGTTGTLSTKVTGVLDSFATPLAPLGAIPSTSPPTFSWSAPVNPPTGPYEYTLWMSGKDNFHWDTERMPDSQLSVQFNYDGRASQDVLAEGANYYWSIAVVDGYGNRAESQGNSFTYGTPGSIQGWVTNASGGGIYDVYVDAYDAVNGMYIESAKSDLDGNYSISLPTGSYKIKFNAPGLYGWYDKAIDQASATPVAVTAPNATTGINMVFDLPVPSISGKVTDSTGKGIPGVSVSVYDSSSTNFYSSYPGASTQSDGSYALSGLPAGSYKVRFEGSGAGYVGQWYNNKTDQAQANPVTVATGVTATGINAVLSKGGAISGKVTNSAGAGIGGVQVSINDANGYYIGVPGAMTQADGSYTVSGLPAGSYKVLFNGTSGYASQWYNNKPTATQADLVAVADAATTSGIDAVLEQGTTDTYPPTLGLSTLANGSVTGNVTLNIAGHVYDEGIKSLTINGAPVALNPTGPSTYFSHALQLMPGPNTITTVATDNAGNQTTDTRVITLSPTSQQLTVTAPADNSRVGGMYIDVTGSADETSTVEVRVNNYTAQPATRNGAAFSANVNLQSGINTIEIIATDQAGNKSAVKRTVTYEPGALSLAITSPAEDIVTDMNSVVIDGTVADTQTVVTLSINVDGQVYNPQVTNGSFSQTITFSAPKSYAVMVTATDDTGKLVTVQRNIIYQNTAAYGATVDLGVVGGSKGGTVTVPVTLTNAGGTGIAAVSVDISYDPNLLLNPTAAVGAAGSAAGKTISSSSPATGVFRVGVLGLNTNTIGDGVVANVTFSISTTAEPGSITLYNTPTATDPAGTPVPVSGKNGAVNIVSKAGDCDGNGAVSIAEVQSAINMFLGLKQVAGCVDIDGNGGVSISEVQKSINSFLGL